MRIKTAEESYNQALEYLVEALCKTSVRHPQQTCIWVLLHCLYRSCNYLPGMSYTRWKYDNLQPKNHIKLPLIPKSRWEIYNDYNPEFGNYKNIYYYRVFKQFVRLGLYGFGDIVFKQLQLSNEVTEMDKYIINTTIKILLNEIPGRYPAKTFPIPKNFPHEDIAKTKAFQAHINGHLEYFRNEAESAYKYYGSILHIDGHIDYKYFAMGLMRYAYYKMDQHHNEDVTMALRKICDSTPRGLVAHFGLGKALYRLNELDEAEQHFAECTNFKLHIPDVWGYLALINLKRHRNRNALECWKYAKINPNHDCSEELYKELRAIKNDDIVIYID